MLLIVILLKMIHGKLMNKNNFIKIIKNINTNNKGLSIVEAVAAAFIVSIGFISIYNLSSVITSQSINSIEREKITMLSNGMMEEYFEGDTLTASYFNSDQTETESDACSESDTYETKSTKFKILLKRWCDKNKSNNGGIGNSGTNDIRMMSSRTIVKDGRDIVVITYQISSKGGQAKKIIRKIINK